MVICAAFLFAPMDLKDLRAKIDVLDTELIRLLNERADLVRDVGEIKRAGGLEIYAPEREEAAPHRARRQEPAAQGGRLPRGKPARHLPRDHVGLAGAGERPRHRLLRPGSDVDPPGRARQIRRERALPFPAEHQRRVRRRGARPGGLRRGAHRKFHRGRGQPHARRVHRERPAHLRAGGAADRASSHGARAARGDPAGVQPSAGVRPMPPVAADQPAVGRSDRGGQHVARGGDGREGRRRGRARRADGGRAARADHPGFQRAGSCRTTRRASWSSARGIARRRVTTARR